MAEFDSNSDEAADCSKHGSGGTDARSAEHLLLESHDRLLLQVLVLLNLTEDNVGGEALNGVVELVLPEVLARVSHQEVRPARILLSMQVLIFLDVGETIFQHCGVEEGVQGVTRRR